MSSHAAELAHRLARSAEAVCRYYLSNGHREGRYWIVGDVANTPGRSLYVRLCGPLSGKGAAGKWTDYVAVLVMLRRSRLGAFPQMIEQLLRNIISLTAPCTEARASTNMEARVCLKKSSFPEPLRDIERRRLSSSGSDISFISRRPAPDDRPCGNAPMIN